MKTASIGYFRDDGDFAILATLNNLDNHFTDESFERLVAEMVNRFNLQTEENIQALEREDAPSYVDIESDNEIANDLQSARNLRDHGYAVIVWTPDELCGVDPEDVQDRSIEHGHMVIDSLKVQSDNEPGALEPQRG